MNIKFTHDPLPSDEEFWDYHAKQRQVKPLSKPCKDCAITTGFYVEMADKLLEQPNEVHDKVVNTWFCHNNCNRGCAGVRKYIDENRQLQKSHIKL